MSDQDWFWFCYVVMWLVTTIGGCAAIGRDEGEIHVGHIAGVALFMVLWPLVVPCVVLHNAEKMVIWRRKT